MRLSLDKYAVQIIVITLTAIIGTFVVAYVGYVLIENEFPESFFSIWDVWDTGHYTDIVTYGYSNSDLQENHFLIAFLPLYPYLMKIFSYIFQDSVLSGLFISNISYIVAAFYLYKLVELDFEKDDALRAVVYFSIFPTAYFLHAAYTESLFLALTISSFYYARKGSWAAAGIIGIFVTMTRLNGILLPPILLLEYLVQKEFKKENIKKDILWIFLSAIGFGVYLAINYSNYGSPFHFFGTQKEFWTMELGLPSKGFLYSFYMSQYPIAKYVITNSYSQIFFTMLAFLLIIYCF
ncbi:MAG: glycosyltransferase family 39 protein, partial [Thermodesulfobacteriota bacterium]